MDIIIESEFANWENVSCQEDSCSSETICIEVAYVPDCSCHCNNIPVRSDNCEKEDYE